MTKKIVLGTRNPGKLAEFRELLAEKDITLFSWQDYDYQFSVIEDGMTFWENAFKKAELTARITGEIAIADDSGLEVDCLNRRPGIFSARYAGQNATDTENNAKILEELKGVSLIERGARFVCALVIYAPDGTWERVEGECRGVIIEALRGENGFGYDPIFLMPDSGRTFAELSQKEKNRISHRARAVEKLRPLLKKYFS